MDKKALSVKITKHPHSEIEIEGEIPLEKIANFRTKAIKKIQSNIELPGFRKGFVPENILISKIGEIPILEEVGDMAIQEEFPFIVEENKIDIIGRPFVNFTKVALGNPLGFKIRCAVFPEVKLSDYKKIAKEIMNEPEVKVEVTDDEVKKIVENVEKMRKEREQGEHKEGEEKKEQTAELDDNFVKSLGDFKDVADFKIKIKENILAEKKEKEKNKQKTKMVEKISDESQSEVPLILVEGELQKMISQFKDDIVNLGLKVEDYFKSINKTEENLKKEWKSDAEKRAKIQIIFNKIRDVEKLNPDKERFDKEVVHIMEHYKNANPENVKIYIDTILGNEKVLNFLESQK